MEAEARGRARGREMRWRFGREPREGVSAVWRRAMRGEKRCEVDETRACGAVRVDARVGIVGEDGAEEAEARVRRDV